MTDSVSEGDWLAALDEREKASFLARLAHALTIAGRASYISGSIGLEHPEWLRQVNEVQHRVLACLHQVLRGEGNVEFQRSIAQWVLDEQDAELRSHMAYAWQSAKGACPSEPAVA